MTLHAATMTTPVGPYSLLVDDDGLCAAGFTADPDELQARLDPSRRAAAVTAVADLGDTTAAVRAYLAGEFAAVDGLPVSQPGGAFRTAAWKAMRAIPAGETLSYRELAERAGSPTAVRAAGSACSQNQVALIIPCHRVVRSDGGLGGYSGGIGVKRWLLAHERRGGAVTP